MRDRSESVLTVIARRSTSATWIFTADDGDAAGSMRRDFASMAKNNLPEPIDTSTAELVLGELVGNAYRHAPGRVDVNAEWLDDCVVLSVTNEGETFELRDAPQDDLMAEHGRGIFLVRSFARKLDVRCGGDGRCTVRAEMPFSAFAA